MVSDIGVTKIDAAGGIPDAWFLALYALRENNRRYIVERGSYEGEYRIEIPDFVVLNIHNAYRDNWEEMRPIIPHEYGIPDPVEPGYLGRYIPEFLSNARTSEEYTYGERIEFQLNLLLQREDEGTNQDIIQVARPSDIYLKHSPCLRHVDTKIVDGKLYAFPYFRSWELWAGLPANLAAIATLQKLRADQKGVGLGSIIASTKSLHIYGPIEPLMNIRLGGNRLLQPAINYAKEVDKKWG